MQTSNNDKQFVPWQLEAKRMSYRNALCMLRQAKQYRLTYANVRIHIILRMHRVSSVSLLSIYIFGSIQRFCWRTAKILIELSVRKGWSGPILSVYARRHILAWCGLYNKITVKPKSSTVISKSITNIHFVIASQYTESNSDIAMRGCTRSNALLDVREMLQYFFKNEHYYI